MFLFESNMFALLLFLLNIEHFAKLGKKGSVINLAQGPTYCKFAPLFYPVAMVFTRLDQSLILIRSRFGQVRICPNRFGEVRISPKHLNKSAKILPNPHKPYPNASEMLPKYCTSLPNYYQKVTRITSNLAQICPKPVNFVRQNVRSLKKGLLSKVTSFFSDIFGDL